MILKRQFIIAGILVVSFLAINTYQLASLQTHLTEIIESNDQYKLNFINKKLITNSIEAEIERDGETFIINLSPSYFSRSISYTVTQFEKAVNTMLSTRFPGLTYASSEVSGLYDPIHHLNRISASNLVVNTPNGPISLSSLTTSLYSPNDDVLAPEKIVVLEFKHLSYAQLATIDYFNFDSTRSTHDMIRIKTKLTNLDFNPANISRELQTVYGELGIPDEAISQDLFLIFPIQYDISLNVDPRLIALFNNTGQDIDSDIKVGAHLLTSTSLLHTESNFSLALSPQEDTFQLTIRSNIASTISNQEKYNAFLRAVDKLSTMYAPSDTTRYIDLNIEKEYDTIEINASIAPDASIKQVSALIHTKSHYKDDITKETAIKIDIKNASTLLLSNYNAEINGHPLKEPIDMEPNMSITIKTNHLEKVKEFLVMTIPNIRFGDIDMEQTHIIKIDSI